MTSYHDDALSNLAEELRHLAFEFDDAVNDVVELADALKYVRVR